MSRIGKRPIVLDAQINATISNNNVVCIEGPKGKLEHKIPSQIRVKKDGNTLALYTKNNSKESRELHGLSRTIVHNMAIGVSQGFCKILLIQGVGYRAQASSRKDLVLNIGYSHPIYMTAPKGIEVEVQNSTEIRIQGISKESVGQFAAEVRSKRPPEPYKGKGIRYHNEYVRKKVGKAGK
jgi:large subunit ribosomal protein L6